MPSTANTVTGPRRGDSRRVARRSKMHERLAAAPGVRAVRRPVLPDATAGEFDLYYVRGGRKSACPLVVIPGGPGAASIVLYRGLRRRAAIAGIDVIMVEHRGVGMSRHGDDGTDLPPEALTVEAAVDDVAAVLDDAGVDRALIYGTSYGTYLAAGLGVRHPRRVQAMVLDSPLLRADDVDLVRSATRAVLWDGADTGTADLAAKVRALVDSGRLSPADATLAAGLYGLGGPDVLRRQLDLLLTGHGWVWGAVGLGTKLLTERRTPYHHEPDLVERIGYRELNYGAEPDGGPLDVAVAMRESAHGPVEFEAEPFDFVASMPRFTWPTVVLAGGRDLTTPPEVSRQIAALIPDSVLVGLPSVGHSVLDTRESVALDVVAALLDGTVHELPSRAAEFDARPPAWEIRLLLGALGVAAVAESAVPSLIPRALRSLVR